MNVKMILAIKQTHVKLETFCPLSDNFVAWSTVDIHLVLKKIISSWSITIPVKSDGRSSTPLTQKKQSHSD